MQADRLPPKLIRCCRCDAADAGAPASRREFPVAAEQAAQPGLAYRRAGGRPAQHREALRCRQPRGALPSQTGRRLGEEPRIHRHGVPCRSCRSPAAAADPCSHPPTAGRAPPPRAAQPAASPTPLPDPDAWPAWRRTRRYRWPATTPEAGAAAAPTCRQRGVLFPILLQPIRGRRAQDQMK